MQDIPPKTRREVIHRDGGKCGVPRCRAARFTEIHHIVSRSDGGNHDASNLTLLCDGHHKALHEGKLRLSGQAPNIVVRFVNDPMLHVETHVTARHVEPPHGGNAFPAPVTKSRLKADDAAHVETAVGAGRHVETPHVETKPSTFAAAVLIDTRPHVETVVRDLGTPELLPVETAHVAPRPNAYAAVVMRAEAKQALTRLGFPPAISAKCVDAALATSSAPQTLEELIRIALGHTIDHRTR